VTKTGGILLILKAGQLVSCGCPSFRTVLCKRARRLIPLLVMCGRVALVGGERTNGRSLALVCQLVLFIVNALAIVSAPG
jgi:hypothetical protein